MAKTLVATIEDSSPITFDKSNTIPIKNLRIAIAETNKFGLSVIKHAKVVLFKSVATAADAMSFKEGDHVFLDECRVESRPYEKDGKIIPSEDLIANVVAKITKKQYADISAQLTAAATATRAADVANEDFTV